MKIRVVLSTLATAIALAAPAAAGPATPENPSAFGQVTSNNAPGGGVGQFVSGELAGPNNPPGTVAADVQRARGALGSTPSPQGNPNPGRP